MLLTGMMNAMPVPGTSMRILRRRSVRTAFHVSSVTTASSTAVNTTSSTVRPEKLDHAAP